MLFLKLYLWSKEEGFIRAVNKSNKLVNNRSYHYLRLNVSAEASVVPPAQPL